MESNILNNQKINSNVDIFVYSHKPFVPMVKNHVYKVLTNSHAEPCEFNTDLAIYRDYDGDNISDKNLMYNEYSGFYWLWKNYPLKDYVGMNHYSRYYACLDNVPDIDEIFKTKKIVLNDPVRLNWNGKTYNNRTWYEEWHNVKDFDLLKEIMQDLFPEYMDGWEKMENATYCYNSSMFIMKKEDFLKYCDFIFPVLQEIRIRRGFYENDDCRKWVESHKEDYIRDRHLYYNVEMQSRIVGYLAERAMNAYMMHNGEESFENKAFIMKWGNVQK